MSEIKKYNPADANANTRAYMDSIWVEERLLDAVSPDLTMELYGKTFKTPIMTPAFSHLKVYGEGRKNGLMEYSEAARRMGAVNWIGMGENEEFGEILSVGADTIRIVKPYADDGKVADQFAYAEKKGAFAIGVDIDHTFGSDGQDDLVVGERMRPQTTADMEAYVKGTKLPFIVKGVLSVRDAVKCAEAGVKGIVVSHHHGRLPYAVPPLMVLPEIVREVGGTYGMKIFVDCSIDRGSDAYKALALGADAVSVGRAMMPALESRGVEGVMEKIEEMNKELAMTMAFTGAKTLAEIDPTTLWINGRHAF